MLQDISTHAPVKERREERKDALGRFHISTHAPVKERQGRAGLHPLTPRHFNSRSCEGATLLHSLLFGKHRYFNSRSCEGATQNPHEAISTSSISTHAPVKERRPAVAHPSPPLRFQLTLL